MGLLFFILLIGPLIFVHELGHFLAARAFGVGVIRFSIGFGPRLLGITRKGTEYVLAALPLGGYVRLVGADPMEVTELDDSSRPLALLSKPVWQRMAILLAGPLANLILPLPIFMAYYMSEETRIPARVGTVIEGDPADLAGFEPGDEILAIEGQPIRYFDQIQDVLGSSAGREVEMTLNRNGEQLDTRVTPRREHVIDPWVNIRTVERYIIGVTATYFGPIIGIVDPTGLAADVGLSTFDRVVRVNGTPVDSYLELERMLQDARGPVELLVFRPMSIAADLGELFVEVPVRLTLDLAQPGAWDRLGIDSAQMLVRQVQPGSPADLAGLRIGDRIKTVDGRSYNLFSAVLRALFAKPLRAHPITIEREGLEMTVELTPVELSVTGDFNEEVHQVFVGMVSLDTSMYYPRATGTYAGLAMSGWERLIYGIRMGFKALIGFILGIIVGVWQLITLKVGLDSLGGPIMIFDIAGRAGQAGLGTFMRMMGLISINLGILNLLPIPVLDGGSLMLFSIEGIMRRPLTMRVRQIATYIGLAFILLLFLLVFKNDIERYWSHFVEFFN